MRTYFTITILLCYSLVVGQEQKKVKKDSLIWTERTCEKGIEDAKADFDAGKYNCFSYGLVAYTSSYDVKFEEFLFEYRKKQYGIIAKNAGCVISDHSECYQKTMLQMVHEKYGADILERSRKEAEELYSKEK